GGLLSGAVAGRRDTRVIKATDAASEAEAITSAVGRHVTGQGREPSLLVSLRGSLNDPGSLVLTESDHELLEQRLNARTGEVAALMRGAGAGRTMLFSGVHPCATV